MEILRVENLTKVYGSGNNKVVALDNVSFSVEKGEFVSIVGASGSGKSTLLHLLGGVDRPTSGKVFINDTDIFKMNDDELAIFRRRQVGLIYQFYNLSYLSLLPLAFSTGYFRSLILIFSCIISSRSSSQASAINTQ